MRSIGLSTFSTKKIADLLSFCRIKPALHQVELHPYLQQWDLKKFCEQKGIYLTAYYPLGGARNMSSEDAVIKHPTIVSIAHKHNKTPAQILIRWCIQRGVVCIPKSVHQFVRWIVICATLFPPSSFLLRTAVKPILIMKIFRIVCNKEIKLICNVRFQFSEIGWFPEVF